VAHDAHWFALRPVKKFTKPGFSFICGKGLHRGAPGWMGLRFVQFSQIVRFGQVIVKSTAANCP
jgi:hypothetical protein